jgi:hypothetical protein
VADDAHNLPDLVTKDGKPVTQGRIRPALDSAIRLIEERGYTIPDAAKAVGYRTHSLVQALHKPHVRAHRADVKRAWRESETAAAWQEMARLARHAGSEDVRFKSAKFLIEIAEEAEGRMPSQARQVVQIVTQNVNLGGQLIPNQSSGVLEAVPYQALDHDASNSRGVGHGDLDDDDD